MKSTRRSFLRALLAVPFVGKAVSLLPTPKGWAPKGWGLHKIIDTTQTSGIVGGINRATFTYWRNQQAMGPITMSEIRSEMKAYDDGSES